ncbi:hypothetical protein KIW84_073047 [Lathyrus oleraceus]|uniref:Uncharacterized protein n=1 Tax=Pisum sativum TaxID=3888 RepID=A0A9D4VMK7_PEA|nr:hypothetical protein KIW84_073047 [Pisum sativum]
MNCAEIGVLKESNKVRLSCFLECRHGGALETEVGLEILSYLTNETLERKLADQKLSALLVLTDFTESDGSWPETMWLLHSSGGRSRLTSGFGCQLLPWGFAAGGLASSLLGTCH